jgi:hypothetical protein
MMAQFLQTGPTIHIYHLQSSFRNTPPRQAAGIVLLKKRKQHAIQYATLYILKLIIRSTVLTTATIISEPISFFSTVVSNNRTLAFTFNTV